MQKSKGSANPFHTPNTVWNTFVNLFLNTPWTLTLSFSPHFASTLPLRISLPSCGFVTVSPRASILVPPSVHTLPPSRISLFHPSLIRHPLSSTNPRPISPFPYGTDPRGPCCPFAELHFETESLLYSGASWFATLGGHHRGPQIPLSEGGAPTSPSSSAPQCRYETRRPATTQGATSLNDCS